MKQIMLELDERDEQMLALLCDQADRPMAHILRWALRDYALRGPYAQPIRAALRSLFLPRERILVAPCTFREVR